MQCTFIRVVMEGNYKMQVHKKEKEDCIHVYQLKPTYPTSLQHITTPVLFLNVFSHHLLTSAVLINIQENTHNEWQQISETCLNHNLKYAALHHNFFPPAS